MLDKLLNFTPHDVSVFLLEDRVVFPTVGVCRALSRQSCARLIDPQDGSEWHHGNWATKKFGGLVVMRPPEFHGVEWTPSTPAMDAEVLVSIVAAPVVAEERPDLTVYVPDTGPDSAVRNEAGLIEGVRRLILWHDPQDVARRVWRVDLLNPLNPGDGCRVLTKYASSPEGVINAADDCVRWGGCIDIVTRRGTPCGSRPWEPGDGWRPLSDAERRDTAEEVWRRYNAEN
jgi:hypothetical protein